MIKVRQSGSFDKTELFLKKNKGKDYTLILEKFAREGIQLLRSATPKDTGLTSESWDAKVFKTKSGFKIIWTNSHVENGVPVVILLQYGHGTQSGTFVEGRDFINPAMRPLFDRIAENLWKEVNAL